MSTWSSTMHNYGVPQILNDLYRSAESIEPKRMSPKDKRTMIERLENLIFNLRRMDEKELEDEVDADELMKSL